MSSFFRGVMGNAWDFLCLAEHIFREAKEKGCVFLQLSEALISDENSRGSKMNFETQVVILGVT